MRIAVLGHPHFPIGEPYRGGLEAHTAQVTEALAALGHDVTLFAKEGSTSASGRVHIRSVVPASFEWPDSAEAAAAADRVLDEYMLEACREARSYDAVLNNSLSPIPYAALPDAAMLTMLHTPATLERVNACVAAPGWRPGRRHRWASVSDANAAGWRRVLPVPVDVIHNGIDVARWPFRAEPEQRLVWSARITPEKGTDVGIAAALATGTPLDLVGPVSDRAYFDREVAPHIDGERIRYLGHLDHDELSRVLGRAAVFVCTPMWDEPFGLAPLEAMACGTPVATLDRGALSEVVGTDGGVVVRTAAALPSAILTASRRDRAAVRAHAETFSLDAMVQRYLAALTALASLSPEEPAVEPIVFSGDAAPLRDPLANV